MMKINNPKKNIIFCIFITSLVCVLLYSLHFFNNQNNLVFLIFLTSTINTYILRNIFFTQFKKESLGKEKNLRKQLEISSKHFNTIIDNMPLIAYITDNEYNLITGNMEARKFFGLKEKEKCELLSVKYFEQDMLELIIEENNYIIKNKQTFITDRLVKLSSGKKLWLRIRKVPLLDEQNEVKGFVVFGRDISVERAAQKQRETYISTLSHDLKIPTLAQIRALELLSSENLGKINDEQKEIIELTLDSCRYMYEMLSTILTTYKYENNDISLNYEKVHVLKMLDDCVNKSYKAMRNKNINMRVQAKDKYVSLYADKNQIKTAFENIVSQCVMSANENTEIICGVAKSDDGQNVSLSLDFESPYIYRKKLSGMFKKYTTSEDKMDRVGSGLGLYLAKQIINAHKGSILVKNRKSNGSTFSVELPCINECKLTDNVC